MHKEICPCQPDQVLGAIFGCLYHQVLQMSRLDRLFVPALTPETHVLLGQTKNHLSQVLQTHPKLLPKVKH
jgi:hypothetical protein